MQIQTDIPGTVKKNAQTGVQSQDRMKPAGNGGIFQGCLQMPHIHVLFVAPLGAGHMAEPDTDQYEGRIAHPGKCPPPGSAADLTESHNAEIKQCLGFFMFTLI